MVTRCWDDNCIGSLKLVYVMNCVYLRLSVFSSDFGTLYISKMTYIPTSNNMLGDTSYFSSSISKSINKLKYRPQLNSLRILCSKSFEIISKLIWSIRNNIEKTFITFWPEGQGLKLFRSLQCLNTLSENWSYFLRSLKNKVYFSFVIGFHW